MTPADKLAQVTEWFDLPITMRPQLITTYIPNIDQMGHKGGPDSDLVENALKLVDDFIGGVVTAIDRRNLTDIVNVLIVSDHGE
jgi:predicted AlkP superfamily pyrophosphatase or phosphodiesterase